MLMYFLNNKNNLTFDIKKISEDLFLDSPKVLEIISSLSEKKCISIEMKKTNGVIEEFISLELFYDRVKMLITESSTNDTSNDIYSIFEEELGRTLSPTEYEMITNWINSNISVDLIRAALKEAILNGVNNLRYIDKILFEWNRKGYKTSSDIVKKDYKEDDYIEELYDYDWLNN
jgi:DNA replication protein